MTPRSFRRWLLAGVLCASGAVFGQPSPNPPAVAPVTASSIAPKDDEMVQKVDLRDAPIDLVLGLLEGWTGRTILRPQQLPTPTFTINLGKPLPKSEAVLALETLLNLNGIGVVPVGDRYLKVIDLPRVRMEAPPLIEGSTLDLPPSGQIATKLFQLEFQRVTEFVPQINMLLNGNIGGYVVFEKSNAALITDSISTLQRIELLVRKVDQPLTAGLTAKFYSLRFAKASDLVTKINSIVQGPLQSQLGASTKYSADDRTNQIVLLADPRQYPFFDDLINKLDVKADPNTRNEVLYLKHAAAKDVATLLSNLISNQTKATQTSSSVRTNQFVPPAMPGQPQVAPAPQLPGSLGDLGIPTNEFSGLVNVQPDERSNAVVVSGTVDDIRLIQELVEKIDVLLAQVRIEVVIAEVSLNNNNSTGIGALGLKVDGNKLIGFNGVVPGLSIGGGGTDTSGNPSDFATINRPETGGWTLSGIVSVSTSPLKNNAQILSSPTITTTHNKEATIFVGETRPTISSYLPDTTTSTGSTTGYGYRTSVNQQEIGIKLKVKPLIGADNSVQLDIEQEVSDVGGTVKVDQNDQPIILKRTTTSFVSVKSGEIIVLGGLSRKKDTKQTNRLGPIPIIGDLLGSRSYGRDRQELIFFLRPVVLSNTEADNVPAFERLQTMPNKKDANDALGITPPAREEKSEDRPALKRPRK